MPSDGKFKIDPPGGVLVPPEIAKAIEEDIANGVNVWHGVTVEITFDPDYTIEDCLENRRFANLIDLNKQDRPK